MEAVAQFFGGQVDSNRTRAIVKAWFDAIAKDDVDTILGTLSPTVVCELPKNEWSALIPNLGTHVGRDAVAEAFRLRSEHMQPLSYVPHDEVIVEGNVAFAVVTTKLMHRRTKVVWEHTMAHRLVLDDAGKISHWHVYFDSIGEAAAFGADLDERLFAAAREGGHELMRELIGYRATPNYPDPGSGLTTLLVAAGRGDAVGVRLLLEAGADVHTGDLRAGGTALHKAVQGGDLDTVRALVEAGAFIDAVAPTTGHTPLLDAFWYKWPDIVGYLLDRGAGLNLTTHYGFTMQAHLEYALNVNQRGREKLEAADALVQERVRADQERAAGQRLMKAVVDGDLDGVRAQLAAGAEVDARYPVFNGFNDEHTPLLVAARDGHTEIVRELVAAGADVNACEPTFGAVPLHKAVYNGHADITRLIAAVPGVDLDRQGATNGYTPLHDAIWHGFEDCTRILLEAGARVDLVGHDGKTPYELGVAVFGRDEPITAEIAAAARS
jgi:ankyrin repeat protein/ketosteroid isomerase-like protein